MLELVDEADSKSVAEMASGFESRLWHQSVCGDFLSCLLLGRCDTGQDPHGRGRIPYPSNNCRAGAGYTGMFSCRDLLSSECGETSFSIRVEKSEAEASQNQPNSAYKIKAFKSRGAIMDICIYITA